MKILVFFEADTKNGIPTGPADFEEDDDTTITITPYGVRIYSAESRMAVTHPWHTIRSVVEQFDTPPAPESSPEAQTL